MTSFQHLVHLIQVALAESGWGKVRNLERANYMADVPFCLTFSKDTTRSDNEPGKAEDARAAAVG